MKKLILFIAFIIIGFNLFAQRRVDADIVIVRDSIIMTDGKITGMNPGTANKDAVNRQQLVDSVAKYSFVEPRDTILFSNDISSLVHQEGKFYYDSLRQTWIGYIGETDVTFEFMYEDWIRVFNNTGQPITNTQVCYMNGVILDGLNTPTVALANAKWDSTSQSALGFATHDIEDGTYGLLTKSGTVRDAVTNGIASGARIVLDTIDGGYTDTPVGSPYYFVSLGNIGRSDISDGTIEVHITIGGNTAGVLNIFNGAEYETVTVDVFSNGTTSKVSVSCTGGGNLSMFFDGEFVVFDTPDTITITNGTDAVPVRNWVYIPNSTRQLTVNTTGVLVTNGFPTNEQYVAIVDVITPSAATAQTDGFNKVHVWTDHIFNSVGQGHLPDLNYWIRKQAATYQSGISMTTNPLEDIFDTQIEFSTTSGEVLQLHPHAYPAKNTATGDNIRVYNDPITSNNLISDLNTTDLSADSEGGSLAGRHYTVTLFGVVSEDVEDCQYFLKLPSGSYSNASSALSDLNEYTNKLLPIEYKGTAFLMYAITLQNSGANIKVAAGGIEDLRESASVGGGESTPGVTTYDELDDTPPNKTGSSNKIVGVDLAEVNLVYKDVTIDGSGNLNTSGTLSENGTLVIKADGSRAFTNPIAGVAATLNAELTIKEQHEDGSMDAMYLSLDINGVASISSGGDINGRLFQSVVSGISNRMLMSSDDDYSYIHFLEPGFDEWSIGMRNSDNAFVITDANGLGSSRFEIAQSGDIIQFGNFTVEKNILAKSFSTPVQTLTETAGAISWDMSSGSKAKVTIDETSVITITNMPVGAEATIVIIQGDADDDNVTFVLGGATVKWRGNDEDLTNTSGAHDKIKLTDMDGILITDLDKNYIDQ